MRYKKVPTDNNQYHDEINMIRYQQHGDEEEDDLLSKISCDKKTMRQWSYSSKSTFYFGSDCAQEQKRFTLET